MPYSDAVNKPWTREQIYARINPDTVLDVGPGAGVYADMLRHMYGPDVYITGAEIWEPYVYQFQLLRKYDAVSLGDVRERTFFGYDLVILGDVVEHMTKDEAVRMWERISRDAKWAIISIPIIHYHQGPEFGNPYETHVKEDWTTAEVLATFPGIIDHKEFDVTGVFLAKFA